MGEKRVPLEKMAKTRKEKSEREENGRGRAEEMQSESIDVSGDDGPKTPRREISGLRDPFTVFPADERERVPRVRKQKSPSF